MTVALCLLTLLPSTSIPATLRTEPVGTDSDDPAIWVNRRRPSRSVIYGTDKVAAPKGGVYVFGLDGKVRQRIGNVDRPNNIDVEYGLKTRRGRLDIAVATERKAGRLRIFAINPLNGQLSDRTGTTAVADALKGEAGEPMGIALYKRKDGAIFAIVSPKTGPADGYLQQYRLTENRVTHRIDAKLVRRFGKFSGQKEIESICVDDELGYVYYSDERVGTRKYHADPDAPKANTEIALFNAQGFRGDHEGIAIWERPNGRGYLVCTDQLPGSSKYHVFRREGANEPVGTFAIGADETDGIEISSAALGPRYPNGLFLAMNSRGRNYLGVGWRDVQKSLKLRPRRTTAK
jgi:3-phytase